MTAYTGTFTTVTTETGTTQTVVTTTRAPFGQCPAFCPDPCEYQFTDPVSGICECLECQDDTSGGRCDRYNLPTGNDPTHYCQQ